MTANYNYQDDIDREHQFRDEESKALFYIIAALGLALFCISVYQFFNSPIN